MAKKKKQAIWPVLVLIAICTFLYSSFMQLVALPSLDKTPFAQQRLLVALHVVVVLFVTSLAQSSLRSPGTVPHTAPWDPTAPVSSGGRLSFGIELKKDGRPRFCRICFRYKPDRCHHCRLCNRCHLVMDHHCPWLHNCVGAANKKAFLQTLLWGNVALALMLAGMARGTTELLDSWQSVTFIDSKEALSVFHRLFTFFLAAFLQVVLGAFFLFHMWLLAQGSTTIEFCARRNYDASKAKPDDAPSIGAYAESPYDNGVYSNFAAVLGPNPLLWLLPTRCGQRGIGLWSQTNACHPMVVHEEQRRKASGATAVWDMALAEEEAVAGCFD